MNLEFAKQLIEQTPDDVKQAIEQIVNDLAEQLEGDETLANVELGLMLFLIGTRMANRGLQLGVPGVTA